MEVLARMQEQGKSAYELYCELQCRLMRRYIAQGGSETEWCERLAPAFRRRWSWLLDRSVPATAPRRALIVRLGPAASPASGPTRDPYAR